MKKEKLVFATHNPHKTEEVRKILEEKYEVVDLHDIGCEEDIEETALTFAGNATIKSAFVNETYGWSCFADDSGLEVDALNGEPGVFSARYGGSRDSRENLFLVLEKMKGVQNRKARFISVISLHRNGEHHLFEGTIEGTLKEEARGEEGFGYDPIFIPDGYAVTFAEMSPELKNKISHRARAMQQLIEFLKQSST